jgi:hypothetical protein
LKIPERRSKIPEAEKITKLWIWDFINQEVKVERKNDKQSNHNHG